MTAFISQPHSTPHPRTSNGLSGGAKITFLPSLEINTQRRQTRLSPVPLERLRFSVVSPPPPPPNPLKNTQEGNLCCRSASPPHFVCWAVLHFKTFPLTLSCGFKKETISLIFSLDNDVWFWRGKKKKTHHQTRFSGIIIKEASPGPPAPVSPRTSTISTQAVCLSKAAEVAAASPERARPRGEV